MSHRPEARMYRHIMAGLAKQLPSQLPQALGAAICGNVETLIAFAMGAEEFRPVFQAEDLRNLPKLQMYLKLSIDESASAPFRAALLRSRRSDMRS